MQIFLRHVSAVVLLSLLNISIGVAEVSRSNPAITTHLISSSPQQARSPFASVKPPTLPVGADNGVRKILPVGDKYYITGQFTHLGQYHGNGLILNPSTGTRAPGVSWPVIQGNVISVIADPHNLGGYLLGGDFSSVGSLSRTNLARILPAGEPDPNWSPSVNGPVFAIVLNGNTLYLAGNFSEVNAQPRVGFAAIDVDSGRLMPWNPNANGGEATSVAIQGNVAFLAGNFDQVGGQPRYQLAAVNALTGDLLAWNPNSDANSVDTFFWPSTLLLRGNTLYVGGMFTKLGGTNRSSLASIDTVTGSVTAWNPNVGPGGPPGNVQTLSIQGNVLYLGGTFDRVDGQHRENAAAIDITTGRVLPWNPKIPVNGYWIQTIAPYGRSVYLGGYFENIQGQQRYGLMSVDSITGIISEITPTVGGGILSIAFSGNTMFVGGKLLVVNPLHRQYVAQVETATGEITPWAPQPNDQLSSLAVVGNTVYMAGAFDQVKGSPRNGLAAVDATSGALLNWDPAAHLFPQGNKPSLSLLLKDDIAYVGGNFDTIGGQARPGLAAVDIVSGQVTPWKPAHQGANLNATPLLLNGDSLYVAASPSDGYSAFAFSTASGAKLPWNVTPGGLVATMALSGSSVLLGGQFNLLNGQTRNGLAAVDANTGDLSSWNPNPQDGFALTMVSSLLVDGPTVYAGGSFQKIGGIPRGNLAAIDAVTGSILPWTADTEYGGSIEGLTLDADNLYVGGVFMSLGGAPCLDMAKVPK